MNLDQTHQVLEPIATRAFDYGDFVSDCVCIHAGWIWHTSSSFSHKVANKIGDGGSITYLTGFGSVYHSRRDCGKLKAAKTVGKFLPCMECGRDEPPRFYENRIPQPVKRK